MSPIFFISPGPHSSLPECELKHFYFCRPSHAWVLSVALSSPPPPMTPRLSLGPLTKTFSYLQGNYILKLHPPTPRMVFPNRSPSLKIIKRSVLYHPHLPNHSLCPPILKYFAPQDWAHPLFSSLSLHPQSSWITLQNQSSSFQSPSHLPLPIASSPKI